MTFICMGEISMLFKCTGFSIISATSQFFHCICCLTLIQGGEQLTPSEEPGPGTPTAPCLCPAVGILPPTFCKMRMRRLLGNGSEPPRP